MGHSRTKNLLSATLLAVRQACRKEYETDRARLLLVEDPPPIPHAKSSKSKQLKTPFIRTLVLKECRSV